MAHVLKTIIQLRRATTAEWLANKDAVPAAGEPCFDLNLGTLKIGNGIKTYEQLEPIGGVTVSADGESIVFEDSVFKLFGFDSAKVGAQPRKNSDGVLEWVVPSSETLEGLQTIVAGLQTDVAGLQTDITVIQEILTPSGEGATTLLDRVSALEGRVDGTGEGSVDQKITDEVTAQINDFATKVSDDGVVNTMKELVDYVASHGAETADIAADITTLQELVGKIPVNDQIVAAIVASETRANALFERTKYEISNKPAGALVDYRDKEIRVMCPADTQFELQNVGANGDSNKYYIGFKAYAPNGSVVSFKEDTKATIEDTTMYYFENNEFAGIDDYGRKYSIVWLPVANYDESTKTWTYYGARSNIAKYIGWYYSVEWYDATGKVVESDTIRINLSNEACHSAIEPYYMGSVIKEISLGGTLIGTVNGKADIPIGAGLKASDEVTIGTDGTLNIGTVSVSKLVNNDGTVIVLDGGGAQ